MDMEIIRIINRFDNARIPMQITIENNEITVRIKYMINVDIVIKERILLEALRKMEKDVFEWTE